MTVYFLTDVEQKLLMGKLRKHAREASVSDRLRGYNWQEGPLSAWVDSIHLPMYMVCSQYCPTHRDIYLQAVESCRLAPTYSVTLGRLVHECVATVYQGFLRGKLPTFPEWWREQKSRLQYQHRPGSNDSHERMKRRLAVMWQHLVSVCHAAVTARRSLQPHATDDDILRTALPFLIEHRVSGELLQLSDALSVDCYDYLHGIVHDLKVVYNPLKKIPWYRLYPTGYAMVLESVYEIPIDIGSVVYVGFYNGQLVVKKDLFFIEDSLRSRWIELRDLKLQLVNDQTDPGLPPHCPPECGFLNVCRPELFHESTSDDSPLEEQATSRKNNPITATATVQSRSRTTRSLENNPLATQKSD